MKFNAAGNVIGEWGRAGSSPGEFDLPHGIATAGGRVYVADRSNARIQIFDESGNWLDDWKSSELGTPYGLTIARGRVYVVDPSRAVVLDLSGSIIATGIRAAAGRPYNHFGEFVLGHAIAAGADGAIYVADAQGKRVVRFFCM